MGAPGKSGTGEKNAGRDLRHSLTISRSGLFAWGSDEPADETAHY